MDKQRWTCRIRTDTCGATAVEYGLIAALIALAALAGIKSVAATNTGMWDDVADTVSTESAAAR